jgi:hypothetical protein
VNWRLEIPGKNLVDGYHEKVYIFFRRLMMGGYYCGWYFASSSTAATAVAMEAT